MIILLHFFLQEYVRAHQRFFVLLHLPHDLLLLRGPPLEFFPCKDPIAVQVSRVKLLLRIQIRHLRCDKGGTK